MIKRWFYLFLVSVFMLQSVAAGVELCEVDHSSANHQALSQDHANPSGDSEQAIQDCGIHQHGHCCHGHFSAVLTNGGIDFSSVSNQFFANYTCFIPLPPHSELLRPPTV
jgi:hypothetical protein